MYKHNVIEKVLNNLHRIASENVVALRKVSLCKYMDHISDPRERELLSLILSFQITSMFSAPKPKFNTVEFGSLTSSIRSWFDVRNQDKTPYIVQSVLYFMTSTRRRGLSTGNVAECLIDYIDPYEWLAENQITLPSLDVRVCALCNINATQEDLCEECSTNLVEFTEYRHNDFTLTIDNVRCPWLIDTNLGSGMFSFNYGSYHIERVGIVSIAFTRISGLFNSTQGKLPFDEYQKPIN